MAFVGSSSFVSRGGKPQLSSKRAARVHAPKMTIEYVGNEPQVRQAGTDCLKDFITRRAVKTVLYYLREFHDGATEKWLNRFENFTEKEKEFFDWQGYIERMFEAESVEGVEVFAHPKGYYRREFKFTIEPSGVARKILASREHLAEEWKQDLNLMDMENLEITRMHYELLMNPGADLEPLKERILDVDPMDDESSPLRVPNYRSIRTLATHYAAHRILQRMKEKSNHHFMWLNEHLQTHPIGPDSEAFLYNLLREEAVVRTNPDTYISPKKVAQMIMNCRTTVAKEWIDDLDHVKNDNLAIQRRVLQRRAGDLFDGLRSETEQM
mmetsp:Transcript_522/g.950  ORF Transcript_522/g.950 Transcript_522/m.950 type:complete len:325 (+) Transcript_522:328-1302(+)